MDRLNFEGWSPIRIYREPGGELLVDWMRAPPEVTRTALLRRWRAERDAVAVPPGIPAADPLADLIGWALASPGLQPSGIVFHVSRCGSTLVTQAFAALDDHVTLSEPRRWMTCCVRNTGCRAWTGPDARRCAGLRECMGPAFAART